MVDFIDAAYLVTGSVGACTSLKSTDRGTAAVWLLISVGVIGLGLLRISEAGVWTDDYLRSGLYAVGWYAERRAIQVACIVVFAFAMFFALRSLGPVAKRTSVIIAVFAFYTLAVLAAVRASSLHWSDAVLGEQVGSVMLSHAAQAILLLVTAIAALFEYFTNSRKLNTQ